MPVLLRRAAAPPHEPTAAAVPTASDPQDARSLLRPLGVASYYAVEPALIAVLATRDFGTTHELAYAHLFGSSSAAASVILGRKNNGRGAWKSADGRALKSI